MLTDEWLIESSPILTNDGRVIGVVTNGDPDSVEGILWTGARVMSQVTATGIEATSGGGTTVLVPAPDGVILQLSDPSEGFDTVPDTARC